MSRFTYMLTLVLTSMLASTAFAMEYDSPYTEMIFTEMPGVKPDSCLHANLLGMNVVKKLDAKSYELAMVFGDEGVVAHGVLKTVKSSISGVGLLDPSILVRYKGVKEVVMDNGFSAKVGVWEECK